MAKKFASFIVSPLFYCYTQWNYLCLFFSLPQCVVYSNILLFCCNLVCVCNFFSSLLALHFPVLISFLLVFKSRHMLRFLLVWSRKCRLCSTIGVSKFALILLILPVSFPIRFIKCHCCFLCTAKCIPINLYKTLKAELYHGRQSGIKSLITSRNITSITESNPGKY